VLWLELDVFAYRSHCWPPQPPCSPCSQPPLGSPLRLVPRRSRCPSAPSPSTCAATATATA